MEHMREAEKGKKGREVGKEGEKKEGREEERREGGKEGEKREERANLYQSSATFL